MATRKRRKVAKSPDSDRTASARRAGKAGQTAGDADPSEPKTTRPEASSRRLQEQVTGAKERIRRKLDATPDRVDIRDWIYRPGLTSLPDQVVNCELVPRILDQGQEGACTGFALAAVINFLLGRRNIARAVSPKMLYQLARRYDEWPGEKYEGSSARGGMKGWHRHGVASDEQWPDSVGEVAHLQSVLEDGVSVAEHARRTPCGAFYRVAHTEIRDVHAAIAEVGIVYCTLMVHSGWDEPDPAKAVDVHYSISGNALHRRIPLISRRGRASDGHAVALVGYTSEGFIVQNSWGPGWGQDGFALLPYEDFLLHATDVWVAQLGVPVAVDVWTAKGATDTTAGLQRASVSIPLSEIRPYAIDIGYDGRLSDTGDYWTTEEDLKTLVTQTVPNAMLPWAKRRLMLYMHSGLNDERAVARRIVAFRDVFLENEIYPLHVMWETGAMQTLQNMLTDLIRTEDAMHGPAGAVGDWLQRFRGQLMEAKDRSLELTLSRPGTAMWEQMKENARSASQHPTGKGAMQLLAACLEQATGGGPTDIEMHVVCHSAGSIFAANAMDLLTTGVLRFRSIQMMAPAISIDSFRKRILPRIKSGKCPKPTLYVLSDTGERDDDVGPYGKSLLYLVSNAFEGARETPLLGMEKFVSSSSTAADVAVDLEMEKLFSGNVDGRPALVVAGRGNKRGSLSRANSHGGFDNDPDTLNSVLWRILGEKPRREFTVRDLQY